jgi:NADH-quinone oxidoreductase subunit N
MSLTDLNTVLPVVIVIIGGTALLLIDLAIPRTNKTVTAFIAIATMLIALLSVPVFAGQAVSGFSGMVVADSYSLFLDALLLVIGVITVLLTLRYNEARGIMRGEFFPLTLFALSGMMLMGHATNLLTIFIAVELLSIPLYILCGFARPATSSEESALKYFLLGAFASGFLVYGIALIYGATGSTDLATIAGAISKGNVGTGLLFAGTAFVLVGLGFKVAAVPFHMWTPDVYEGAPTTVTAFMSTATKAAGFAAVLRVFLFGLAPIIDTWQPVIAVLAALTMIVGNVVALSQNNLKRMLAYSSIAHAGYLLCGIAAGGVDGATGVLFYLASYAMTSLAAFAVMTALAHESGEDQSIDAYGGLFRRKPLMALVMAVAMFSLMGIPPLGGFLGKYFLFKAAVGAGLTWLAVVGVITSVVSAYYYLRVIVTMFNKEPGAAPIESGNFARNTAMAISTAATVLLGIAPTSVINLISSGMLTLAK